MKRNNLKILLIFLLFLSVYINPDEKIIKPKNVPDNAKLCCDDNPKKWIHGDYDNKYRSWDLFGKIRHQEDVNKKLKKGSRISYYTNGKINEIGQRTIVKRDDGHKIEIILQDYGMWEKFYENGSLQEAICYFVEVDNKGILSYSGKCEKEIYYNEDGSIKEQKENLPHCNLGCGHFVQSLPLGTYQINGSNVNLREKPDKKSKSIQMLNKGMQVEVVANSKNIEKIKDNIYPWVKIKLEDGKVGFVYGVYLTMVEGREFEK